MRSKPLGHTYRERLSTFEKLNWDCRIAPEAMARAGFYICAHSTNGSIKTRCFFCKVKISDWKDEDDPIEEHMRLAPGCEWVRVLDQEICTLDDRLATFQDWPHTSDELSALSMAQAGFFYNPDTLGDDTAECAFCQICFREWAPDDIPFEAHQATSPSCSYVLDRGTSLLHEIPVPDLAPPFEERESSLPDTESSINSGLAEELTPILEATEPKEIDEIVDGPETPSPAVAGSPTRSVPQDTTFMTACDGSRSHSHSRDNLISMVSVEVEEVSLDSSAVESTAANSNNENDPETPKDLGEMPTLAPPLSIFRSTFTSTPFGRVSPNSLLSHPMPSPLPDLGRHSFEPNHSRISPVMYPRLPSFPKELSSPTPSKMEDTFYSRDDSTPSPQRSPLKSLQNSLNIHESRESLLCRTASPPSFEQSESTPVSIKMPTKGELAKEWESYLPQSSIEFLLNAKDQTVAEWQALLADEVSQQLRRITAQALEQLEAERVLVVQQVRDYYNSRV